METLTDTAKATILLCTPLALKDKTAKPYAPAEWHRLGKAIVGSSIGNPGELFHQSAEDLCRKLFVREEEAARIETLLSRGVDLAIALDDLARQGIFVVTKSDAAYPRRLKTLLKTQVPPVLYYGGDLSLAETRGIAVVGSRNIDAEGERYARELVTSAVQTGLTIYSGGAHGIDEIAAGEALKHGGSTVAVLADSMVRKIRQKAVREAVAGGKMLLLSAVLPQARFTVGSAMGRNKYVYALSQASCVIASDKRKGGTWAGAEESLKHHLVPVFVWDTDRYPGNRLLLELGATPIPEAMVWEDMLSGASAASIPAAEELSMFAQESLPDAEAPTEAVQQVSAPAKAEPQKCPPEPSTADGAPPDIFHAVWPFLRRALAEHDRVDEIVASFKGHLVKKQVTQWLEEAVEQGIVKKTMRPVSYHLVDA